MSLQSLQLIPTAQMFTFVHGSELCGGQRYLTEFRELTVAEVNRVLHEAAVLFLSNGLGPHFHFLLDRVWSAEQATHLVDVASLEQVNSTDTAVQLKKR